MTRHDSESRLTRRARAAFAFIVTIAATSGWIAAAIGALDRQLDGSQVGERLLVGGLICGSLSTVLVLFAARGVARAAPKLAILAFGIWPFVTFGLFIHWRSGLADEQLAACHAGDGDECMTLGRRKERRGRVEEARPLYEAGCALTHARSCAALASVARDLDAAETDRLFTIACDGGVALACTRLARLIRADDPARAKALLDTACALDDASACAEAALLDPSPTR